MSTCTEHTHPIADERYPGTDHFRTANNVTITHGLRAWDYDGVQVTVSIDGTHADPTSDFHQYWNGWFDVVTDAGGRKTMNGERLTTVHPFTGVRA